MVFGGPGTEARHKKFVLAFHDLRETQHVVTFSMAEVWQVAAWALAKGP